MRDVDLLRRTKERITGFGAVQKMRDHERRVRRLERAGPDAPGATSVTTIVSGGGAAPSTSDLFLSATSLVIASGAITIARSAHWVDTEATAASDDLDTINGGTAGRLLFLGAAHDARTVVVKHGTGNILCVGNADITLDDQHDYAICWYDENLSKWKALMGGGGGGGGGAPTSAQYVTLASDGTLSAERVFGDGAGTDVIDGTTTVKVNLLPAMGWALGG